VSISASSPTFRTKRPYFKLSSYRKGCAQRNNNYTKEFSMCVFIAASFRNFEIKLEPHPGWSSCGFNERLPRPFQMEAPRGVREITFRCHDFGNRPGPISQYSKMALRLLGQTFIFCGVFFVFKSLLGIDGQKKR